MQQNTTIGIRTSYNIQTLRAVAAVGVVCHHIIDSLNNYLNQNSFKLDSMIGSYGVDLFFVISGYVMMMVSSRKNQNSFDFMKDRIVRIVPLYWLLTFVACIPLILGFQIFANKEFSLYHLFTSLFFVPPFSVDDHRFPILFVGWTLNYEMFFYILFSLTLGWLSFVRRSLFIVSAIFMLVLISASTSWPAIRFIGNPLIVGFAFGVLLWDILAVANPSRGFSLLAIFLGCVGLVLLDLFHWGSLEYGRVATSFAAMLIVGGSITLERNGVAAAPKSWSNRIGDASYALYLVHPFIIQVTGKLALASRLNQSNMGLAVACLLMMAGSIFAGLLIHRFVEKPIISLFKK